MRAFRMRKVPSLKPSIRDGRDLSVAEKELDRVRHIASVKILDVSSDPNHDRSVFTYIGGPRLVLEATQAMAEMALDLIDMTVHQGSRPRMGALDVVNFVPVRGMGLCARVPEWHG